MANKAAKAAAAKAMAEHKAKAAAAKAMAEHAIDKVRYT